MSRASASEGFSCLGVERGHEDAEAQTGLSHFRPPVSPLKTTSKNWARTLAGEISPGFQTLPARIAAAVEMHASRRRAARRRCGAARRASGRAAPAPRRARERSRSASRAAAGAGGVAKNSRSSPAITSACASSFARDVLDQVAQLVDGAAARLDAARRGTRRRPGDSTPRAARPCSGSAGRRCRARRRPPRRSPRSSPPRSRASANSSIAAQKISWRVRSFLRARRVETCGGGTTIAVAYSITGLKSIHGS